VKHAISLTLISCLLSFSSLAADLSKTDEFTLCYEDQHLPPFMLGTEPAISGEPGGILVEYIQRAADVLDYNLTFVRYPWLRCQQAVKTGQIDGLFAFIYSEERNNWAAFPKTDGEPDQRYSHLSRYPIFVAKGSSLNWDGEVLLPTSAIVQSIPGYIADKELQAMGFKPIVGLQPKEALALLTTGRLDGYVMDELIGKALIKQLGLTDEITQLAQPFLQQPWYVAFSRSSYQHKADSIEAFWSAMQLVREQHGGTIIKSYLDSTRNP
jgi:polar amino acid transport system substrate-binding protein